MVDGFPKMVDREKYSVYYSDNIYNISEDINETPIGEIIYLETNHLEHYYYSVKEYDFDKGILKLNLTIVIETYEQLRGKLGPEGYVFSAKDIYQYDFLCKGKGTNEVDCQIFKDDESKIRLEGKVVLVHCKYGISRSVSFIIAYLIKYFAYNVKSAIRFLKTKRNQINPNEGFLTQLYNYEKLFKTYDKV